MQVSAGVLLLVLAYFGATYFYKEGMVVKTSEDMGLTQTDGQPVPITPPQVTPTELPALPPPPPVMTIPEPSVGENPKDEVSMYKNGEYSADGSYTSPAGEDSIGVTLTLVDGVITAATVTPKAENPTSKKIQNNFAGAFQSSVIGKKIETVSLGKVAGSSLTPQGFNKALEVIKTQVL